MMDEIMKNISSVRFKVLDGKVSYCLGNHEGKCTYGTTLTDAEVEEIFSNLRIEVANYHSFRKNLLTEVSKAVSIDNKFAQKVLNTLTK